MQSVAPIDVEAALAQELAAALEVDAWASPVPDDVGPNTLVVQSLGGVQQTQVSDSFSVIVYAYATTYADAMSLAAGACRTLRVLWFTGAQASDVTFTTSEADPPYEDPDPDRPTLRRATVRAIIGARGIAAD